MKTLINAAFVTLALVLPVMMTASANAGYGCGSSGYGGHGGYGSHYSRSSYGYSTPIYRAPSVYVESYRPASFYSTPHYGVQKYGHFDSAPHFNKFQNGHFGDGHFHN
jgi:hypothetical protein